LIRLRDFPGSIVAQLVPVSAFLHSLGQNQKSATTSGMSAAGVILLQNSLLIWF